jgi:hypothetical protein
MLKMMTEMITEAATGIEESGFHQSKRAACAAKPSILSLNFPHTSYYFLNSLLYRAANSED